jgi:malate dehydrogenase (oxaloacetate-decarboxylating)(NADP+)
MKSGVARIKIENMEKYKEELAARLDPSMNIMQSINAQIKKSQKRVVFAEGEDPNILKAAIAFKKSKLGIPILIGKEEKVKEQLRNIGLDENFNIEIISSKNAEKRKKYTKHLYEKRQRSGMLERDCDHLVRNDRVTWGSCMVSCGDADAMVTGVTRHHAATMEKLTKVVNSRPGEIIFGLNMMVSKGRTVFVADTNVHDNPTAGQLVQIAISSTRVARLFGFDPKVAFLSHSTFGKPATERTKHVREAIELMKTKKIDFDYDGEMQPDVALNPEYKESYPFSKIVGNANILIMPALHSASISVKLMKTFGGAKLIGPLLIGLGLPVEIAPLRSSPSDILNLASIAAYSSEVINYKD